MVCDARALSDCTAPAPLMGWEEARAIGLSLARPVDGFATMPLAAALGRVTIAPCMSPVALPLFDNSAMDGYVLAVSGLTGPGPWTLPIAGRIAAGDSARELPPGAVLRILTGAPIPSGADAVVMQEHVRRDGAFITLDTPPSPGINIRRVGEDLSLGGEVLPAGRELGPRELGVLAATGQAEVAVRRSVRVALLCSGSELREPGETLAPGQIWNANRFLMSAALTLPWVELVDLGAVPDDPTRLAAALLQAADSADLVISTGGMADGDEDHMPRLLRENGGSVHALKVAIKPGKPVGIGRLGGAVHVGLPGNPVAAFVTWAMLGAPLLRKLAGFTDPLPVFQTARLSAPLIRKPGRAEFRPARLRPCGPDGLPLVELMAPNFSARIALLASADGLALIPATTDRLETGALVDFLRF
ncbi:MAG: molybdopterin molybdotransferase MoeA [Rhodobacteraceae bacterium]|nr:molybdopterin molybdotransferase MoeA [Paracoccaceae bacterium]